MVQNTASFNYSASATITAMTDAKVYVLYENEDWAEPLRTHLCQLDVTTEFCNLSCHQFSLAEPPPPGVFYSRMSASAHTRAHRYVPEYTLALLSWLETHNHRAINVINGSRVLALELSKARQYAALQAAGIRVPETHIALGPSAALQAAAQMTFPLIHKPNCGGKGLGVQKFDSLDTFTAYANSTAFDAGPDGISVLQRYIKPKDPFIIRNEFVAGELLYSVRVDTSSGFELCPADFCTIDELACPVGENPQAMFEILPDFYHPELDKYRLCLGNCSIEIAGIEMIFDEQGTAFTYDINTNTNYNSTAEQQAGYANTERSGPLAIAKFLQQELQKLSMS